MIVTLRAKSMLRCSLDSRYLSNLARFVQYQLLTRNVVTKQGGPHEHQIAAVATQLREVATPAFAAYCAQVRIGLSLCLLCPALIDDWLVLDRSRRTHTRLPRR